MVLSAMGIPKTSVNYQYEYKRVSRVVSRMSEDEKKSLESIRERIMEITSESKRRGK